MAQKLQCRTCRVTFSISEFERAVIQRAAPPNHPFPAAKDCPACREQRRLAFRNERQLYRRRCSATNVEIISVYDPAGPYQVYEQQVWWSDQYDPLAYGRDFDFSRGFFEQFAALDLAVPKLAILNAKSENCAYTNYSAENRDCYLLVGGLGARDCYYSYRVFYSADICDCFDLYRCELCYECFQCSELYDCSYSRDCHQSSHLVLCSDCIGCHDCFGCINLRNQRHMLYNQQLTETEYRRRLRELLSTSADEKNRFAEFSSGQLHRAAHLVNVEHCSGDQLLNCKNCRQAFVLKNSEDCEHVFTGENNRDCADANFFDNCELQYNCSNLEKNYRTAFGILVWYCSDSFYLQSCFNSKNVFGCSGMKRGEYCILNKPYRADDYFKMIERIAQHMKETGEWGEFFPLSLSPFAYNESTANDLYPLAEAQVQTLGGRWRSDDSQDQAADSGAGQAEAAAGGSGSSGICVCGDCGKRYRIVAQELKFYEKKGLAAPRRCPECRHRERMKQRRPRKLWPRICSVCGKPVMSSLPADQPEPIACSNCFEERLLL